MARLPTTHAERLDGETVPALVPLTGALLLAGVAVAVLALAGQIVVFLVLVVLGPVLGACVGAAVAVEVERAMLYQVVSWRPPRLRLALTGVLAGLPVTVIAISVRPVALSTIVTLAVPALVLQAALLAYLSSPPPE